MAVMKNALTAAGLKPYLMVQPLAFKTPDAGTQGFIDLPEFPFGEFNRRAYMLFVLESCEENIIIFSKRMFSPASVQRDVRGRTML